MVFYHIKIKVTNVLTTKFIRFQWIALNPWLQIQPFLISLGQKKKKKTKKIDILECVGEICGDEEGLTGMMGKWGMKVSQYALCTYAKSSKKEFDEK